LYRRSAGKEEIDESPSQHEAAPGIARSGFLFFLGQGQEYLLYRQ
jgi:hypothetical protein